MPTLEEIRKPVARDLEQYEEFVRSSLASDSPYLTSILNYVFDNRGKGIRLLLVMLCAALHREGRELNKRTQTGAMLIEMVHSASLVHDDVVDEAYIRRGKPSVNALWQSRTAVLVGDYILAKSFTAGMESGEYEVVTYITKSMWQLCEGELIQFSQSESLTMTRDIYFDIIHKKTASLIATSCGAGTLSVGATPGQVEQMREFGECLGMAFQIKDDILDYSSSSDTGKPTCGDIRERKITLPLLAVLEKSSPKRNRELIDKLSDVRQRPQNVEYIYNAVVKGGGLEMAAEIMNQYVDRARKILESYPGSPYKHSLGLLCGFVAERNN